MDHRVYWQVFTGNYGLIASLVTAFYAFCRYDNFAIIFQDKNEVNTILFENKDCSILELEYRYLD